MNEDGTLTEQQREAALILADWRNTLDNPEFGGGEVDLLEHTLLLTRRYAVEACISYLKMSGEYGAAMSLEWELNKGRFT